MFRGANVDNTTWAVLVAASSVVGGVITSFGTAARLRHGMREERRREINEIADSKVAAAVERTQLAVTVALESERHERLLEREASQAVFERMRVEITAGQKEILDRVVDIQTGQAAQAARLDAHDVEITRLRDGKNGGPR